MSRKDKYKLRVTRRESFSIDDEPEHSIVVVEMEGEPIEYQVGVAGEFVSRRIITIHDRIRGWGLMEGYVMAHFENGSVYSRFKGSRDGLEKTTSGSWKSYHGTGELTGIRGVGTFELIPSESKEEFILQIEGDYEAA